MNPEPSRAHALLPACMGGFCSVRTSCARFNASNRAYPSERLCSPKRTDMWQPISVATQRALEAA